MKRCVKCGRTDTNDNAAFCSMCGGELEMMNLTVCSACGGEISSEMRFCPNCATPVGAAPVMQQAPAPEPAPTQAPIPAPQQTPIQTPAPEPVPAPKKKKKTGLVVLITILIIALVGGLAGGAWLYFNNQDDYVPQSEDDEDEKKEETATEEEVEEEVEEEAVEENPFEGQKLRIGISEYTPMFYLEEGRPTGFDYELGKYVCNELGMYGEFHFIEFENMMAALDYGSIDCIWRYDNTEERAEVLDFSDSYITMNMEYGDGTQTVENWAVAFAKDRGDDLIERVNKALAKAKEDGTIDALTAKYGL